MLTLLYMLVMHPTSSLFPYTTLFRSLVFGRCLAWELASRELEPVQIMAAESITNRKALRDYHIFDRYERSEEHTSELQSHSDLVCRLLLEKKKPVPVP